MGMGATLSKLLCLEIFLLSLRLANEFYIYIYIYGKMGFCLYFLKYLANCPCFETRFYKN